MKKIVVNNGSIQRADSNLRGKVELVFLNSTGSITLKKENGDIVVALPVMVGGVASKVVFDLPNSDVVYDVKFN